MTGAAYTVEDYLTAKLPPSGGVPHLQTLAGRVAAQGLDTAVMQLRERLAGAGVDREECRRMHILINSLYHAHRADMGLIIGLQDDVNNVLRLAQEQEQVGETL